MRKFLHPIPYEEVVTPVRDSVGAFVPDQSISLRDMMLQFAYIGADKLQDIVNRGYDGDEDDEDIIGVDVSSLDFAEVHDRVLELQEMQGVYARALHALPEVTPPTSPETSPEVEPDTSPEAKA